MVTKSPGGLVETQTPRRQAQGLRLLRLGWGWRRRVSHKLSGEVMLPFQRLETALPGASLQSPRRRRDRDESAKAVHCPRRNADLGPFEATQVRRVRTRLIPLPAAERSLRNLEGDTRWVGGLNQRPRRLDEKGRDPTKTLGLPGEWLPACGQLVRGPDGQLGQGRREALGHPSRSIQSCHSGGGEMWETRGL